MTVIRRETWSPKASESLMATSHFGCELRAADIGGLEACDLAEVRELISRHGLVVFKGFEASPREFEAFTDALAPGDPVGEVRVPPGDFILQYHAEDAYTPYRPDVIWLLCVNPGDRGGVATVVADTVATFSDLSDRWQEFCREHRLHFGRLWSSAAWEETLGREHRGQLEATLEAIPNLAFDFLPNGDLFINYSAPLVVHTKNGEESFANSALHAVNYPKWHGMSLDDGSPVPEALLSHVREVIPRHEVAVDWNAGDFLAIENFRTMHRRPAYEGSNRVLCRRNCRSFYGSPQPDTESRTGAWVQGLLTQRLGSAPVYMPIRSGPLNDTWRTGQPE